MRCAAAAAALAGLIALTGCGDTKIDSEKAEGLAREIAESGTVPVKSVSCPEDVTAEKGKDFSCDLEYDDGTKAKITIHQQDDEGNITAAGTDIQLEGK